MSSSNASARNSTPCLPEGLHEFCGTETDRKAGWALRPEFGSARSWQPAAQVGSSPDLADLGGKRGHEWIAWLQVDVGPMRAHDPFHDRGRDP